MSEPAPQQRAPIWPMYRALVGVGLACGLLIVLVYQYTLPIIEQNRIEARDRAIFHVLPGATTSAAFVEGASGFEPAGADASGGAVFAGYDDSGALVGLAIEASAMGYQDVVRLLYGYSFERDAIIGIRVLESRETPGLGTRIETDPAFLANFEALDVSLDESGQVANPIQAVKAGQKDEPWEIDCITGATISSEAVADMLRASTIKWIPAVEREPQAFERAE